MTLVLAGSAAYGLMAGILSGCLIVFFATYLGTATMAYRRDHRAMFEICQWSIYGAYLLALLAPVWFLQPNPETLDEAFRALSAASIALVAGMLLGIWLLALIVKAARIGRTEPDAAPQADPGP